MIRPYRQQTQRESSATAPASQDSCPRRAPGAFRHHAAAGLISSASLTARCWQSSLVVVKTELHSSPGRPVWRAGGHFDRSQHHGNFASHDWSAAQDRGALAVEPVYRQVRPHTGYAQPVRRADGCRRGEAGGKCPFHALIVKRLPARQRVAWASRVLPRAALASAIGTLAGRRIAHAVKLADGLSGRR